MSWAPLWLSVKVSLIATLLAGLVGVPLACALHARRVPGASLIEALITAPMVIPPTVLGYAMLVFLGRSSALGRAYEAVVGQPLVFSVAGAVAAASVGALPFVVKSSRAALDGVDPRFGQVAQTLGASPLKALLTVTLPMARGGVAAGLTLGLARAMGDFGMTLMVAGNIPGLTQTASLAIYDAVLAGKDGDAARMVAALTAVSVSLLWAGDRLGARGAQRS